jgi:20S proteasome alpha/beta subunit
MFSIMHNRSSIVNRYPYPLKDRIYFPDVAPRREFVTIAVGFLCRDGILLCADTQISKGSKSNESKILKVGFGSEDPATSATVLVAICGAVKYARMGARHCFRAISKLPPNERTVDAIADSFEQGLKALFKEHLFPHPQFKEGVTVQYLVGIQARGEIGLFSTHDTSIDPVDYESVGSGGDLADYLSSSLLGELSAMNMKEVAFWAVHVLMQVKSRDLYCGGYSEMQSLGRDGSLSRPGHFEISVSEEYLKRFETATKKLFSRVTADSEPDFNNAVSHFQVEMIKVREEWEKRRAVYEDLFKVLTTRLK